MSQDLTSLDYDQIARRGGDAAMRQLGRFFMKEGEVYEALRAIAKKLDELNIPYAIAGGMALNVHGYRRATEDVDVLVTQDGLTKVHQALDGLGYVPPFPGSKQLKDTQNRVRIEFLVTGQFPGDEKPKPVAFPDPAAVSVDVEGIHYINLTTLLELKLASGLTSPGRLKDLADVQELIKVLSLSRDLAQQLNPYVQQKYLELWSDSKEDPHAT
ncbi:MAG TPA: hypothetical protein VF669_16345 [Tepidisphaeraceae bacterium]|jgi:hypothetical protein